MSNQNMETRISNLEKDNAASSVLLQTLAESTKELIKTTQEMKTAITVMSSKFSNMKELEARLSALELELAKTERSRNFLAENYGKISVIVTVCGVVGIVLVKEILKYI